MKLIRMVSCDAYSDYGIMGLFTVEADDGVAWLRQRYQEYQQVRAQRPGVADTPPNYLLYSDFMDFLRARGDMQEVRFEEWHLGSYGRFEPEVR